MKKFVLTALAFTPICYIEDSLNGPRPERFPPPPYSAFDGGLKIEPGPRPLGIDPRIVDVAVVEGGCTERGIGKK